MDSYSEALTRQIIDSEPGIAAVRVVPPRSTYHVLAARAPRLAAFTESGRQSPFAFAFATAMKLLIRRGARLCHERSVRPEEIVVGPIRQPRADTFAIALTPPPGEGRFTPAHLDTFNAVTVERAARSAAFADGAPAFLDRLAELLERVERYADGRRLARDALTLEVTSRVEGGTTWVILRVGTRPASV